MRKLQIVFVLLIFMLLGVMPTAIAFDERVIDIATVTWRGATPGPNISEVERAIQEEVGPRWKRYTTIKGGQPREAINFKLGKTLTQSISLNGPINCEGREASTFMNSIRTEAYKRLGIESWRDRFLLILIPKAGCIWSGRALVGSKDAKGGILALHDSASAYVIVHELGHTLGLGHTNFLRCKSGSSDGPWGEDCKAVEYGGAIDIMGNIDVDLPLSTYNQWLTGYLDTTKVRESWLTEEIELTSVDVDGPTRAIFLRDGRTTYWIEYRRAWESSPYKPGLVIYRTDPPPTSAIVSPNPEDSFEPQSIDSLVADTWMLNWDDYSYADSKKSGSMALPLGNTATVYSKNISIKAVSMETPDKVLVRVERKPDRTPPPRPELTDPKSWRAPKSPIVRTLYADLDSEIARFEIEISGEILPIGERDMDGFSPTFLNPLSPDPTIYLRNLPEGDYNFRLRAVDVWGNASDWSKSSQAYIDRGIPTLDESFTIESISPERFRLNWTGARDRGVGLCETLLHNDEGFVLARSQERNTPNLDLRFARRTPLTAQVFDCAGNGVSTEFLLESIFTSAREMKRSGKWVPAPSNYGEGSLRCQGRCTALISLKGSVNVFFGDGGGEIFSSGKSMQKIPAVKRSQLEASSSIQIKGASKVIRITGRDFVLAGVSSVALKLGQLEEISKDTSSMDISLNDPAQQALLDLGFNQKDFNQQWSVLPMARGTTLLDPTLDLCGFKYLSDDGRLTRRQISVTRAESPYLFLSTESVRYKSINAATEARNELLVNYRKCLTEGGGNENGVLTPYIFSTIPEYPFELVDKNDRLVVRATIGSGGAEIQLLAFYQYYRAFFTGLYVVTSADKPLSEDELMRWYEVASIMAERLKQK